ncbi:hypothetical protein FPZ49_24920 [Paenibacillus cremeus]|uniref:Uncharacterized protein n=1 Tax=Paenibacillus cremeus TaxID=2163881 RepID=A0A559K561_9BACL|nr:hypothetical protein FPZ49_24920 [Paenibacillus cremeus]
MGDKLTAGKESLMTFTIKDAKIKNPITNLQPYLGAVGHVVILSADAEQHLHVHRSFCHSSAVNIKP